MSSGDAPEVLDFAQRLAFAIKAEEKSPSRTERESGLPQGYIVKLLGTSKKAKQIFSPGPEVIRKLVDYLHIEYEWLAIGRGPMRASGWAPSALEEAMLFARRHGTREDAIEAAVEHYRHDERPLSAVDWILAFDAASRRLERAGVPRPELAHARQRKFRRLSRRHAELELEIAELERAPRAVPALPPAPKHRKKN